MGALSVVEARIKAKSKKKVDEAGESTDELKATRDGRIEPIAIVNSQLGSLVCHGESHQELVPATSFFPGCQQRCCYYTEVACQTCTRRPVSLSSSSQFTRYLTTNQGWRRSEIG